MNPSEPTGQQQPEAMETVMVNKCKEIYPLQSAFDTSRFYEGFKQGVIYAGSSEAESMLGAMARKQFDLLQERAQLRAEVERLKGYAEWHVHDTNKIEAQAEEIKRQKELLQEAIQLIENLQKRWISSSDYYATRLDTDVKKLTQKFYHGGKE